MRTTISIHDALLEQAKAASLRRNCSLGEVIDDALRCALVEMPKVIQSEKSRPLKTFRGSGLQPGVDLTNSAGLLEVMEGP